MVVNRVLPEEADGAFVDARRRQEAPYLAEIGREFGKPPRFVLPLQAEDVHGLETLRRLGRLMETRA